MVDADDDVGPTIAGNPGYGFAGNWGTGYGVVGVLVTSYDVVGVSVSIYNRYFSKYIYVLYVFVNKHTYIIYFS
jgi:hypothetical protein